MLREFIQIKDDVGDTVFEGHASAEVSKTSGGDSGDIETFLTGTRIKFNIQKGYQDLIRRGSEVIWLSNKSLLLLVDNIQLRDSSGWRGRRNLTINCTQRTPN